MSNQSGKNEAIYSHIVGKYEYRLFGLQGVFEGAYFAEKYIQNEFKRELDDFGKAAFDRLNSYIKLYKTEPEHFVELTCSIHLAWSITLQKFASDFLLPDTAYDDLVEDYEELYKSVAEIIKEMVLYTNLVDQTVEYNNLEREIKSALSGRWNVGGIGVTGAVAGMVTSTVLNKGTDLIRSGINNSKYKKEKRAGEKLKEELFNEIIKTIRQFINKTKYESLEVFLGYINRYYPGALWKVDASLENRLLKECNEEGGDKSRKLVERLKANPYKTETYAAILSYILQKYKGEEREKQIDSLMAIAKKFNTDWNEEIYIEVRNYMKLYRKDDISRCEEALWAASKFCFNSADKKNLLENEFNEFLFCIKDSLSLDELEAKCKELVDIIEQCKGVQEYTYLKKISCDVYLLECRRRELVSFSPEEIDKVLCLYKDFQNKWSYSTTKAVNDLAYCVMKFHGISLNAPSLEELRKEISKLEEIDSSCGLDLSKQIKEQRAILQRIEEEDFIRRCTVGVISDYDIENKCCKYKYITLHTEELAEKYKSAMTKAMEICSSIDVLKQEIEYKNKMDELEKIYLVELEDSTNELASVYAELIASITKQKEKIIFDFECKEWDKIKKGRVLQGNAQAYYDMLKADFRSKAIIEEVLKYREALLRAYRRNSAKDNSSLFELLRIKMLLITLLITAIAAFVVPTESSMLKFVVCGIAFIRWISYIKKVYVNIKDALSEEARRKKWCNQFFMLFEMEQGEIIPKETALCNVQKKYIGCENDKKREEQQVDVDIKAVQSESEMEVKIPIAQREKTSSKWWIIIAVIVGLWIIYPKIVGNDEESYINVVKNGEFTSYPKQSIGEIFDGYFEDEEWIYREEDKHYVEFFGTYVSEGNRQSAVIGFNVEDDKNGFSLSDVKFGGLEEKFTTDIILTCIFDGSEICEASCWYYYLYSCQDIDTNIQERNSNLGDYVGSDVVFDGIVQKREKKYIFKTKKLS